MRRLVRRVRGWWQRRTVQFRITAVATAVAWFFFVLLARLSMGLVSDFMLRRVDSDLRHVLDPAAVAVAQGDAPVSGRADVLVRVLDTGGQPVDDGPPTSLDDGELRRVKAGEAVLDYERRFPFRWMGTVVTAPDGAQRLVVTGTDVAGLVPVLGRGIGWLWVGVVIGSAVVAVTTWVAVRRSLRPVERMRLAATTLPGGERLPVPESRDELRALAEALNDMLARRDEASARLRRFTGDAAHELRSPVASIRAQAEVAVAHPDPDTAQEVLRDVAEEAERLSHLVDDLLTLARADAGRLPPVTRVDLVAAVAGAVRRAEAAGARWVRVEALVPAAVLAAPTEVAAVVDNLVGNARRYARALIRVSVLPNGREVRLVVDDDGPGVPEEHRARVFDRFYRVQDDRARDTGGAGLGLAMVAEMVRRRGGSVSVGSSPEGGARFEVRWPASPW
ncbi:sensor histidine kinase [Streptoalloteichus hindustanus]|uniref:histidine kinase n=1 Tax=Streptoalloteichus hindustanus TaxID=2017 RepID=A0A1M5IYA8_STRHI|nr:HAMP domain-containing sensor histidine kinase [Streptoalloteichus hindustanus]SHG33286.1 Signal transduction histidine kinase [Streptoalloteichus hindustanus]